MHNENEYQSQPVRNGGIISSLYVGTTEQLGSFVQFWCKNEGNGWKVCHDIFMLRQAILLSRKCI